MKHVISVGLAVAVLLLVSVFAGNSAAAGFVGVQSIVQGLQQRSLAQIKSEEANKSVPQAGKLYASVKQVISLIKQNQYVAALNRLKGINSDISSLSNISGISDNIPMSVTVYGICGDTDIKTVRKIVEATKLAINRNELVKARLLLGKIRDEIVIETRYLPLNVFRQTVSLAEDFLGQNSPLRAIDSLNIAIYSIYTQTTLIPWSIVEAEIVFRDALRLSDVDRPASVKLLDVAIHRIRLANVLGYVTDNLSVDKVIHSITNIKNAFETGSTPSKENITYVMTSLHAMEKGITYRQF